MTFKIFAATLLLALPAASAESPLPKLRIEPTTGGSIFYVKNISSQPLTAYLIELVDYPGSYYALWKDEIRGDAIAPDKELKIPVGNMTVGAVPDYVKLQAALYADGSTAGAPEKVAQLVSRRRFILETVRDLTHRLERAQEAQLSREAAAASLKQAAEFMLLPPKADRTSQLAINQAAGRELFGEMAEYLTLHTVDQAVVKLHVWEKILQESKPAL